MRRSFGGSLTLLIVLLLGACSFIVVPIPIPRGTSMVPASDATAPEAAEVGR